MKQITKNICKLALLLSLQQAYGVWYSSSGETGFVLYDTTTKTKMDVTDLRAGIDYLFKVRVRTELCTETPFSNEASAQTDFGKIILLNLPIWQHKNTSK